jgi:predicted  nucleic acid-binding Zn-ribbon protein
MTKGADLYHLQCLDGEGDALQRRLAEVEAALGESEALGQARQALEHAQALIQKWALRQRDLELEIQGLSNKTSRSEQRLYGGTVKNPKELADLQAEIAALRRRRQRLEDALLETMIEREETEAARAQAQEHLDRTRACWSAQQADLMAEQEMLQERLAEIEQARVKLLPSIEAGDITVYQALRRRKGGVAVVQVRDGACGGCGVTISSSLKWQLRQDKLVCCDNCERIIVRV